MLSIFRWCWLLPCVAASPWSRAVDLGTVGPTYRIAEENLLAMIDKRLREKERSGELARLRERAVERSTEAVRHPAALGLPAADSARTYYYDPTYVLDRNIVDAAGNVLFAAGIRKNPLEIVSMSHRLLFLDGADPRQVTLARQLLGRHGDGVKPVLTGGSYLELMKQWRVSVYYDQRGLLTRRLGITHVPALVSQEGNRLRVDELVPR